MFDAGLIGGIQASLRNSEVCESRSLSSFVDCRNKS